MNVLDSILEANRNFIRLGQTLSLPVIPRKKLAIFTCMDTRLVDFLEPALGIGRGDAKIIKNAGNTIVDPTGGVIRSLVAAVYLLGCEEILVVGHKECGMAKVDSEVLKTKMLLRGVKQEAIDAIPDLKSWVGAISSSEENVINVVKTIRESSLIPKDVPVHGAIICPDSGSVELLHRDY